MVDMPADKKKGNCEGKDGWGSCPSGWIWEYGKGDGEK